MGTRLVGMVFILCGCLALLYGMAAFGDLSGVLLLILAAVLFGCAVLCDILVAILRIERQNKKY